MKKSNKVIISVVVILLLILLSVALAIEVPKFIKSNNKLTTNNIQNEQNYVNVVTAVFEPSDINYSIENEQIEAVENVIKSGLKPFGLDEIDFSVKNNQLIAKFPLKSNNLIDDIESALNNITQPGDISLWHVKSDEENNYYKIGNEPIISASDVIKAEAGFDDSSNQFYVLLKFDDNGRSKFAIATEQLKGEEIATYFNDTTLSVATVFETIVDGVAMIIGNLTSEDAKSISDKINYGLLPYSVVLTDFEINKEYNSSFIKLS